MASSLASIRESKDPELIISHFCCIHNSYSSLEAMEVTSTRDNGGRSNYNGQSVVVGRMVSITF